MYTPTTHDVHVLCFSFTMEFENLVECLCEYAEGVILYAVANGNGPENDAMTGTYLIPTMVLI